MVWLKSIFLIKPLLMKGRFIIKTFWLKSKILDITFLDGQHKNPKRQKKIIWQVIKNPNSNPDSGYFWCRAILEHPCVHERRNTFPSDYHIAWKLREENPNTYVIPLVLFFWKTRLILNHCDYYLNLMTMEARIEIHGLWNEIIYYEYMFCFELYGKERMSNREFLIF